MRRTESELEKEVSTKYSRACRHQSNEVDRQVHCHQHKRRKCYHPAENFDGYKEVRTTRSESVKGGQVRSEVYHKRASQHEYKGKTNEFAIDDQNSSNYSTYGCAERADNKLDHRKKEDDSDNNISPNRGRKSGNEEIRYTQ